MKKKIIIGSLSALICEIFYGLSYIFTKHVTDTVSPLALLGWRFLIAVIIMSILALVRVIKINVKKKNFKPLLLVVLFNPILYFFGETFGISNTTASESGVFLACIPIVSLIASTMILKKKPSKIQLFGILITFVGVIITVLTVGLTLNMSIVGYLFLILAIVSYSLYCVFVEKSSDFSGVEITFFMLVSGAIIFLISAFIEAGVKGNVYELITLPFNNKDLLIAILYQGIGCSILAFFLSNFAISKIGVNGTSSFVGISTVVSILASVLFLNEKINATQIIGVIIILTGVYVANIKIKKRI